MVHHLCHLPYSSVHPPRSFFPSSKPSLTGCRVFLPFQTRVRPGTDAHERHGRRGASSEKGGTPYALCTILPALRITLMSIRRASRQQYVRRLALVRAG